MDMDLYEKDEEYPFKHPDGTDDLMCERENGNYLEKFSYENFFDDKNMESLKKYEMIMESGSGHYENVFYIISSNIITRQSLLITIKGLSRKILYLKNKISTDPNKIKSILSSIGFLYYDDLFTVICHFKNTLIIKYKDVPLPKEYHEFKKIIYDKEKELKEIYSKVEVKEYSTNRYGYHGEPEFMYDYGGVIFYNPLYIIMPGYNIPYEIRRNTSHNVSQINHITVEGRVFMPTICIKTETTKSAFF
jgi:hypothetical protein